MSLEKPQIQFPKPGTVTTIVAGSGEGKTAGLIQMGKIALIKNLKVLHISLEESTCVINKRYDGSCCASLLIYEGLRAGTTIESIRELLEELKSGNKFLPNILIVDYHDLLSIVCASTALRDQRIDQDLVCLARNYNMGVITAKQQALVAPA